MKAMNAVSMVDEKIAKEVTDKVVNDINGKDEISVEEIQDLVENNLIKLAQPKVIKEFILYRAQRSDIREVKASIGIEDELKITPNALSLLDGRYLKIMQDGKKETPSQMFKRTAKHIAAIEKKYGGSPLKWQKIFYNMLANQIFYPNMPTLSNSGIKDLNYLSACYVLSVDDSMESIFSTAKDCAMIMKSGGGIGLNFSNLRPRNDLVKTTGKVSSGVVGFLPVYNAVVESVKQGGMRRGAALGLLSISHPDIIEYINCKKTEGTFSNFNLSVGITDKFMSCVLKDSEFPLVNPRNNQKVSTVRARYLLDMIAQNMWESGEPGIVFFDTCQKNNPTPSLGPTYKNACVTGDTLIAVADGRGSVSIKQLVDEGKNVPVYCKDDRGWTHIRIAFNIHKTGEHQKIMQVTFDDGTNLKITPTHKFYLKDGSKVETKDLQPGMSLMRFDRTKYSKTSKKNTMRKSDYWEIQRARGNVFQEHKLIEEFLLGRRLLKDEAVHHIDFNGLNNSLDNLIVCDAAEHIKKYHDITGDKNPIMKLKASGKFEDYKKRNSFYSVKGEDNPMFGHEWTDESISKISNSLKKVYKTKEVHNKGKTKNNYPPLQVVSEKLSGKEKTPLHRQHLKESKMRQKVGKDNHKVISVEELGYDDVYNMTVDGFHNYCIITSNNIDHQSGITVSNCAEVDLIPWESCNLGSLNLTKFYNEGNISWTALSKAIENSVHFLDDIVDATDYSLQKIKDVTISNRKIGLGVMGFADLLYMMRIPYNSDKAVETADKIMEFIYIEAKKASEKLAQERGAFPNIGISIYSESTPIRNASFTVIAPTGEISILANCSPGIEPRR